MLGFGRGGLGTKGLGLGLDKKLYGGGGWVDHVDKLITDPSQGPL